MSPKKLFIALGLAAGTLVSGAAHAAAVIGGSALLTAGYANQLETWLGEGSITLTNIFTKQAGDTSADFHAAADGQGRTFVVISGTEGNTGNSAIYGGYNPHSWNSCCGYYVASDVSDRTGFLFNLSLSQLFPELTGEFTGGPAMGFDAGQYQAVNILSYGPTFGGGHDFYVTQDLSLGYSYLYSYADINASNYGTSVIDGSKNNGLDIKIAGIEVFTISEGTVVDGHVPEPGTLALVGLAVTAGAATRRRRPQA